MVRFFLRPQGKHLLGLASPGGAGRNRTLGQKEFDKLKVVIPTLPEQRKIAEFLTAVDGRIGQLIQKKALLEDYKKGVMQQLFTQAEGNCELGITNEELNDEHPEIIPNSKFSIPNSNRLRFKDDHGNDFPDWEEKTIGDIADIKGGKRIPKGKILEAVPNGFPYITVSDFDRGSVDLTNIRYVPLDVVDSIKNYTINTDDIFISVAGTLGLVGIIPGCLDGANLTENANKLTNLRCDQGYLLQYLKSEHFRSLVDGVKTTGAQPKLAIYAIKAFKIPRPLLAEQKKIANFLSAIDRKIETVATQITETKTFKRGLLQQMFV